MQGKREDNPPSPNSPTKNRQKTSGFELYYAGLIEKGDV